MLHDLIPPAVLNGRQVHTGSQHGSSHPWQRSCGEAWYAKVSQDSRGPLDLLEHLPQNQNLSVLPFYDFHQLLWHERGAIPDHLSLKEINFKLQLISLLGIIGVFQSKPLRWLSNFPDRFIWTPIATHMIVYSLPTTRGMGSLRYSNSIEPLGELEIIRIELVEDFIVEPMLAAKFAHPLYCVLGSILINIVGI